MSESIRESFDGIKLLIHEQEDSNRIFPSLPPPLEALPNVVSIGKREEPRGILKFFKRLPPGEIKAIREVGEAVDSPTNLVVK